MRQVVFLISAFLVLFQFYSTATAAPTDSDAVVTGTGWDGIKEYLYERTDAVGGYIVNLRETVENVLEKAGIEKSTKFTEYIESFLRDLSQLKKIYAAAIEIIKANGLPNEEDIEKAVEAVVDRVREEISNIRDEVAAGAPNTPEEREKLIEPAIQQLKEIMQIEPGQVVASLRNNGSKKNESGASTGSDIISVILDAYLVLTIQHTEIMKDWLKDLVQTGIDAWKNADRETLDEWATGIGSVMDNLDKMEVETWKIIDAVKGSGSSPASGYQEKIDATMQNIQTFVNGIVEEIKNKNSETPEEIKADVEKYVKGLFDLVQGEWDSIEAAYSAQA